MLRALLLLIAALALPSSAAASEPADPGALADAAVLAHPSIEALRARTDALRHTADAARLWVDPMLVAELSNLPVTRPLLDSHPMAGVQLKLQQRFPAPGEPAAREAAAHARVEASEAAVVEAANALRAEVHARYWDLTSVRQLRGVTADHVVQLDELLGSIRARYEVGHAEQHDLLQLQLRRDRLAEVLVDFDAREAALLAALNGARAEAPDAIVVTPSTSPELTLAGDPASRREALVQHPRLAAHRARADAARSGAAQALIEARPEPTVWLGYRVRAPTITGDAGTNFVTAGVSVPLPFASARRFEAAALAQTEQARASEAAAEGVHRRLSAALEGAEARYARAMRRAEVHRDALLPAARTALDSTLSAYQVDRATFADLIRTEIALLEVERELLLAATDAARAHAEITTLLEAP